MHESFQAVCPSEQQGCVTIELYQWENSARVRKAEYDMGLSVVGLDLMTHEASSSHTPLSWNCRGASEKVILIQLHHKIWSPSSPVTGVFRTGYSGKLFQSEFFSILSFSKSTLSSLSTLSLCLKPTQLSNNRWRKGRIHYRIWKLCLLSWIPW